MSMLVISCIRNLGKIDERVKMLVTSCIRNLGRIGMILVSRCFHLNFRKKDIKQSLHVSCVWVNVTSFEKATEKSKTDEGISYGLQTNTTTAPPTTPEKQTVE